MFSKTRSYTKRIFGVDSHEYVHFEMGKNEGENAAFSFSQHCQSLTNIKQRTVTLLDP